MGILDEVRKLRVAGAVARGRHPSMGDDGGPEAPAGGWHPILDDEGVAYGEPAPILPTDVAAGAAAANLGADHLIPPEP